ncbi:MAG TPA: UvrD-helicase domain-containing protein [Longimicrobiales bacterium]|nr:UvrD-helicase domain-containing protein [Longimicrobiales bacterium]
MSTLDLFEGYDWDAPRETLPRELILASAGSGKTFHISSAIIALLARGERADAIFASTFTRKAAGEILDRVLLRLAAAALSGRDAAELARHTRMQAATAGPHFWMDVLERVVRELHRINIGTLDAFFVRTAGSFMHELGMPAHWTIADEPTGDWIRSLALEDVLRTTDADELLEMVRSISRTAAGRSVHEQLLRQVRTLMQAHYALRPDVTDHWSAFDRIAAGADAVQREAADIAARIAAVPVPLTAKGTPNKNWEGGLEKLERAVRTSDWETLLSSTLTERALAGDLFGKLPVPPSLTTALESACGIARADLARRLAARSHALRRLAALFAEAAERRRVELGAYEFDDITRMLGGTDAPGTRDDMYYRLDARARHILLDEFQDTSVPQWEALEPLADELMSGHAHERVAVIVADPKQSIYGWRGGAPDLVTMLRAKYVLGGTSLTTSWRSSHVVLDFVNDVFGALEDNAVWGNDELACTVAADWKRHFERHTPAKDLAGHVHVSVGPPEEERGEQRPRLARHAARHVHQLCQVMPGRTIAVLTRTNAAVARMMLELKNLGVHASEEGGNPLTDAAPVASLLALLRMVDHPGSSLVRYHVAKTPVGTVCGYTDHTDEAGARRLAAELRRRLVEDGYGRVLGTLAQELMQHSDRRERRRLGQLVELAHRYEPRATLRPSDFVHFVQRERVEDPTAADVRVMTVHQAKGLEFDVVVLPQLDTDLVDMRGSPLLAFRTAPGARITRAFPYVKKALRPLFEDMPELHRAADDAFRNELRDGLSALYVAVTRAKHALHIIVKPDGDKGPGNAKTGARLVREVVAPGMPAVEDAVLYESGDPLWHAASRATAETAPPAPAARPLEVRLRQAGARTRALPRRSPSELEGNARIDVANLLRVSGTAASRRGTIAHAWLERLDAHHGLPDDAELARIARRIDADVADADIAALAAQVRTWVTAPDVAAVLAAGDDTATTVEREVPFLLREGDTVVEGFIDRLVLTRAGGRVVAADVIDFKTDELDAAAIDARVEHYRPQLAAYRRAVSVMYGLAPDVVSARLVFLHSGRVVPLKRSRARRAARVKQAS